MQAIEIIKKKRDRETLSKDDIYFMVNKYCDESIPDYQMSAFLMSVCINGMNAEETSELTNAMLYSGEIISHQYNGTPLVGKHSTGGVGDKTSIPLAPAVAACGLKVPKLSGRGLGHTGGTLDKLEAIPGIKTKLTVAEYKAQVDEIGCVISGQTGNIAPADKKIYALRDVTGCVESIPLISSSIMSKKLAEGADSLVLDVKFGSGAFMKNIEQARILANSMVSLGTKMGKQVTVCLTNMDQPLGKMIGNTLEIIETIDILKNKGPKDSTELTIELGAEMLLLADMVASLEEGRAKMRHSIESGAAFDKFLQMIKYQGGDISYLEDPSKFTIAKNKVVITAQETGFIAHMDSEKIGTACVLLGGGRCEITDSIDHSVGIEIHAKIGQYVEKDQPILTLFANEKGLDKAIEKVNSAIKISSCPVDKLTLCQERISTK